MSSSLPHIHKLPLWLVVFLSNPRSYYPDEQECKALKKTFGVTPQQYETNMEFRKVFSINQEVNETS